MNSSDSGLSAAARGGQRSGAEGGQGRLDGAERTGVECNCLFGGGANPARVAQCAEALAGQHLWDEQRPCT